jgi:phosphoadenosine phosphosulfate reductase
MFKKFLRECGITDNKNELTNIYDILISHGKESEIAWGIIYTNFAYNAQCSWYLNNLNIGESYSRELVSQMLIDDGVSKGDATSIITAFKRFTQLPLGTTINFGSVTENGRQITALMRRKATMGDSRVVLYSLYKFAEACEGYYQFTLTRLLDHNIESQGISPTKIFGFDEDEMKQILVGLTARYPEFIDATFTHNLDKINLREDKTSQDILKLF